MERIRASQDTEHWRSFADSTMHIHTHTHIHFTDPTFVHRRVNMKHVRKCTVLKATESKNILSKSIYKIYAGENKVNTASSVTDRRIKEFKK